MSLPLPKELAAFAETQARHCALNDMVQSYGQACREQALEDAAQVCDDEKWVDSGKKSIDYIKAFNEGCTDCESAIRRLI